MADWWALGSGEGILRRVSGTAARTEVLKTNFAYFLKTPDFGTIVLVYF